MTGVVLAALLLSQASAYPEWYSVYSLSCGQLKVEGKRRHGIPYRVYRAESAKSPCCDNASLVYKGKTKMFGDFRVPTILEQGHFYYLTFAADQEQFTVKIKMTGNNKQVTCGERNLIVNFKNRQPEVVQMVRVD